MQKFKEIYNADKQHILKKKNWKKNGKKMKNGTNRVVFQIFHCNKMKYI